jgi:hypothetical protein
VKGRERGEERKGRREKRLMERKEGKLLVQ